jgi:ABC-type phosphate transport system permease subunit
VVAVRADFTDAILKDANLVRANLKSATFAGANLAGADMTGADLAGADMRGAIMVGTKTYAANISGADMSGALTDKLFGMAAMGAALLTLLLLFGILLSLFVGAWPAIAKYGLGFLTSTAWDPVQEEYGGLVMIYGTLATSFIALLIAVPVSFGIALFLTELSPSWLKRPLGTAIELLAAVPSIVYGMWRLLVFGPILSTYVQQPLQQLFAGVP